MATAVRRPRVAWGWFVAAAAACWLVGHGCHGADEDHEPHMVSREAQTSADADPVGDIVSP